MNYDDYLICFIKTILFIYFEGQSIEIHSYNDEFKVSPIWKELFQVRNIRPSFVAMHLGMIGMVLYTGFVWYILRGREPWTFQHKSNEISSLQ